MSKLPEKFTLPKERIPRAFAQGPYNDCVAITFTKILEVFNYIRTGKYTYLSKGYMYGRNNRPGKTQGGSDYDYMLNMLLTRGTVPEELCPERDEIPCIVERLEKRTDIAQLDKIAEEYKIDSWEKISGDIYKLENIKKFLYGYQLPIAGNMTGNKQHCTVIVGYDGDKLVYQDHDAKGELRTISHNSFNCAYYIIGGIEEMSDFKVYTAVEFEKYIRNLKVCRNIELIQLHHTYSPGYKQFSGNNHIALQTAMRHYHINNNGWSDIAQHFTVFPDGLVVSGRSIEKIPAGIKGANTGAICIECLGNFDCGGDIMSVSQKNALVSVIKTLVHKFGISVENGVVYHCWWSADGKKIGDYNAAISSKTCPGTNFFGGNTLAAYRKNLQKLIEEAMTVSQPPSDYKNVPVSDNGEKGLEPVETVNDIVWELSNVGIITDSKLWMKKCEEDVNVYWLCRKMANYLRGTLRN